MKYPNESHSFSYKWKRKLEKTAQNLKSLYCICNANNIYRYKMSLSSYIGPGLNTQYREVREGGGGNICEM